MSLITSPYVPAKPLVPAFRPLQDALAPYAELLARLATGLFLMPHGAQKLFGLFGGYGLAGTGQFCGPSSRSLMSCAAVAANRSTP